MREVLVWWAVLVLVWLGTLNAFSYEELAAAAVLAVPCAIAARLGRRAAGVRWSVDPRWARWLPHLAWAILHDTIAVLAIATRQDQNDGVDELPMAKQPTNARQAAHEALATATLSATPGAVVIDANDDHDSLTVHTVPIGETALRRAVTR